MSFMELIDDDEDTPVELVFDPCPRCHISGTTEQVDWEQLTEDGEDFAMDEYNHYLEYSAIYTYHCRVCGYDFEVHM